VAHALALGGIGLNIGANQGNMAQAHHNGFLAEAQDLNEQTIEGIEVAAPELTDAAVVRLLVGGEHPECGAFPTGLLDLSGAGQPDAVGVQEQHQHHPRVVGLLFAGILLPIDGVDRLNELSGQIQQKEHQMVPGSQSSGDGGSSRV
jgi:hypothetical protein